MLLQTTEQQNQVLINDDMSAIMQDVSAIDEDGATAVPTANPTVNPTGAPTEKVTIVKVLQQLIKIGTKLDRLKLLTKTGGGIVGSQWRQPSGELTL